MSDKPRCSKRVYSGTFTGHICNNAGKVHNGGKWYCAIHDPVRVAARNAVSNAKYEAESNKRIQAHLTAKHRGECFDTMLDVLVRARDAIEALDGTTVENEKLVDDYRAIVAKAQQEPKA